MSTERVHSDRVRIKNTIQSELNVQVINELYAKIVFSRRNQFKRVHSPFRVFRDKSKFEVYYCGMKEYFGQFSKILVLVVYGIYQLYIVYKICILHIKVNHFMHMLTCITYHPHSYSPVQYCIVHHSLLHAMPLNTMLICIAHHPHSYSPVQHTIHIYTHLVHTIPFWNQVQPSGRYREDNDCVHLQRLLKIKEEYNPHGQPKKKNRVLKEYTILNQIYGIYEVHS